MKTIRTRSMAMALFGGAMVLSANAEKVRFNELPTDLKDQIRVHSGTAAIEDVDRQVKDGKTTYEVAFKKNGQHAELLFDDRGQLVNGAGASALDSRKIKYNELPEAVRRMADARLKGAAVNDVDRQVKNGQATYEIGFKKNGQQEELVLSQDGRIVNDTQVPETATGAASPAVSGTASSAAERARLAQPVTLSATEKVQLNQLPEAVQKAIATAAKGARVEDVERGIWRGQNVYEAGFKDNGKHVEVQVRENGRILYDPRNAGAAPATTTGRGLLGGRPSSEYANVTSLVPLSSGEKVEHSSLPGVVQRRLRTHVGTQVEDIERGMWQGKMIYQVAFKDVDGKHVELQVDERGNVVFDPRTKH